MLTKHPFLSPRPKTALLSPLLISSPLRIYYDLLLLQCTDDYAITLNQLEEWRSGGGGGGGGVQGPMRKITQRTRLSFDARLLLPSSTVA